MKYDGAAPLPILLYLLAVCVSLMYTVCRSRLLPCAAAAAALTALIFLLFYKVRFRPLATTLSILALVLAGWFIGAAANAHTNADGGFMTFLFTASAQFDVIYAAAAVFIFSVVIGFVGCYFSVISPRPCFLMLLMFIPMILSFRTSRELPVYLTLIMAGCFVFACANLSVPVSVGDAACFEDSSNRRRRTAVSCAAALAAALVTAILPRANDTPVSDALDRFMPQDHGYFNTSGLSNFASRSSVNTGNNDPSGNLLFTVNTQFPDYLKRWAFDSYNEDGWTALDTFNTGYPGWEYNAKAADSADLLSKLVNAGEDANLSDATLELISGLNPVGSYHTVTGIYIADDSSSYVVIHPTNTYCAILAEECGRTYRTARDDVFTESPIPQNGTYYLRHFVSVPDEEFLRRVDYDGMAALIEDAYSANVITSSERSALSNELNNAVSYRKFTGTYGVTDRIQSLADKITAGLTSDYDKALALEKWFGDAGFVYDMEFVPEEKGVEYFLFESRRGICSDYAAALTLLARAAGLPARYCEGFAVSEDTYDQSDGLYYITDAQAHAWPQIYIPGAGWLDFDGTKYAAAAENGGESAMLPLYAAAGAAALAVLIFVFRKPLGWVVFCAVYPLRSKSGRVRGVYLRTRRLAAELTDRNEEGLSAGEVRKILTDRLSMPTEAEKICSAADELFYSPKFTPSEDLLKYLKALKKRRRRLK